MTAGRMARWAGVGLLAASLLHGDVAAEQAGLPGPVELRVLTYNTHGLPAWIARDRPAWRMPRIGRLLSRYDVALVQENFAHHDRLRAAVSHDVIVRGHDDSGLTTFGHFDPREVVEVQRTAYDSCSGWLWGASDCFADKGFLRLRLSLPHGARLDVVNTHLEAGRGPADHAVRAAQVGLLVERLRALRGAALVLGGDLNLRFDEPRDRELLLVLTSALGLADSGALPGPGWDRIDYLLVRGSERLGLEVLEAGMAGEFQAGGEPLSDHPALFVRLRLASPAP